MITENPGFKIKNKKGSEGVGFDSVDGAIGEFYLNRLSEDIKTAPEVRTAGLQRAVTRGFDVFLSGVGLTVFSPAMAYIACKIKKDGGSAFFIQERFGKDGKRFKVRKFRSIALGKENEVLNRRNGDVFSNVCSEERTSFGNQIANFDLDELPGLGSVVAGHMGMVGPRPLDARSALNAYESGNEDKFNLRLLSDAGWTGAAQVHPKGTKGLEDNERQLVEAVDIEKYVTGNGWLKHYVVTIAKTGLKFVGKLKGNKARNVTEQVIVMPEKAGADLKRKELGFERYGDAEAKELEEFVGYWNGTVGAYDELVRVEDEKHRVNSLVKNINRHVEKEYGKLDARTNAMWSEDEIVRDYFAVADKKGANGKRSLDKIAGEIDSDYISVKRVVDNYVSEDFVRKYEASNGRMSVKKYAVENGLSEGGVRGALGKGKMRELKKQRIEKVMNYFERTYLENKGINVSEFAYKNNVSTSAIYKHLRAKYENGIGDLKKVIKDRESALAVA